MVRKTFDSTAACASLGLAPISLADGAGSFLELAYARLHLDQLSSLALLASCVILSAILCYLFSEGGFLFFSGSYPDPSLAQLAERIAMYYPRHLNNLALYTAAAAVMFVGLRACSAQREEDRA